MGWLFGCGVVASPMHVVWQVDGEAVWQVTAAMLGILLLCLWPWLAGEKPHPFHCVWAYWEIGGEFYRTYFSCNICIFLHPPLISLMFSAYFPTFFL